MAYDREKDYKALMDAAAASGDFKAASQYEQLRNEKIADIGLGYEQSNTYQHDTPVKSIDGTDYYKNGTGYEGYDDGDLINYVTTAPSQLKKDAASGVGGGALSGGGGSFGGGFGGGFSYDTAPLWTSKYSKQIDALTKSLLGRDAFSYNPQTDPLYQNYLDQYTRGGNQAMQDTLGQVSARTGGLASSYATGAAQGAYNGYMQQAADKMPDLYKLAYSMYQDDGNQQMDNIGLLQGLENTQYGRYQDSRDFNYGVGRDAVSDARYTDELGYSRERDALGDARYEDETAYDRQQDALAASKKSSSGGGGGGPIDNGYTSVRDTMVSLGIKDDTSALEYLISTGMGITAAQALSDGYSEYYQQAVSDRNSDLPTNMSSVLNLGYGPIDAERLQELVESGEVEEYVENGKLNYRRAGTGGSNSLKGMMGINGLGG